MITTKSSEKTCLYSTVAILSHRCQERKPAIPKPCSLIGGKKYSRT
jgi:hypothetical protein